MPDSWEKIERAMEVVLAARKDDPDHPDCVGAWTVERWLTALRALREREVKRWQIVQEVERVIEQEAQEYDAESLAGRTLNGAAYRLREAREGK